MKLSLYFPVKPNTVNQGFGATANLQWYKDHGVNFTGHNGIDFAAYHGQPVYAAHDGIVEVQEDVNQGWGVVITSLQTFDYNGGQAYFKTIYWHFNPATDPQFAIPVKTGQLVKAGDIIGYADNTGLSTGDHLHFGLKPQLKNPDLTFYNIEQNNGYMGAIDPTPYFNGFFAQDKTVVIATITRLISVTQQLLNWIQSKRSSSITN